MLENNAWLSLWFLGLLPELLTRELMKLLYVPWLLLSLGGLLQPSDGVALMDLGALPRHSAIPLRCMPEGGPCNGKGFAATCPDTHTSQLFESF